MSESTNLLYMWLDRQKDLTDSQETFKSRKSDVCDYIEWVENSGSSFEPIEEANHKLLLDKYFRNLKKEGYARATIDVRWWSIKKFYGDLAGFFDMMDETPFESLSRSDYMPSKTREETKSEKPYVTKEQKEILCENVTSPAFRNECMIRLMWQTGLRRGEVVNLRTGDVNLEQNKLEEFWSPKISTRRTVTFKDSLTWWLDQWKNGGYRDSYRGSSESDYLFLTNRSEKMPSKRPNMVIRKAAENGNIQYPKLGTDKDGNPIENKAGHIQWGITSHAIRRGHAMHLLKNDVDLRTIQKRLGHAKLETTIEYLPISPEDTSDKIEDITF